MRAVTRPVDLAPDLTAVARGDGVLFVRDGVGLAGRGVAATVPADGAVELLAGIDHEIDGDLDPPSGAGPVAVGWVPYEPGGPGELIVPAVTVRVGLDGHPWITTIDGAATGDLVPGGPPPTSAGAYTIEPVTAVDHYLNAVAAVRDAVQAGALTKAVIAREIAVRAVDPIDVHGVLRRLEASFGSSYRYSVDGLVGASPELLVEVDGRTVRSYPLAGTAPRTGDVERDRRIAEQLLASTKDQVEHRVVIDVIHDTLLPWCSYLDWEPEPSMSAVFFRYRQRTGFRRQQPAHQNA